MAILLKTRLRRAWIVKRYVRTAALVVPVVGQRRFVALGYRLIALVRVEYRLGNGPWERLPCDMRDRVKLIPTEAS